VCVFGEVWLYEVFVGVVVELVDVEDFW